MSVLLFKDGNLSLPHHIQHDQRLERRKQKELARQLHTQRRFDNIFNCFLVFLIGLGLYNIVINPFGFFIYKLHSLTLLCSASLILFLSIFLREEKLLWKKFLLIVVFFYAGYNAHDSVWALLYQSTLNIKIIDIGVITQNNVFIYALIILYGLQVVLPLGLLRWKLKEPKIYLKSVAVVLVANWIMLLWLSTTQFFSNGWDYSLGFTPSPPEGLEWFVGKAVSFLVFPLVFVDLKQIKSSRAFVYAKLTAYAVLVHATRSSGE